MRRDQGKVTVSERSWVDPTAVLDGEIAIGDGCFISPGVVLRGKVSLAEGVFIGERTVLCGDITVGAHTTIQIGVVIRGANRIGSYVNIYDLVNLEGGRPRDETGDRSVIGDGAWINHGATMHGCEIGAGAAICINAALDYHCRIGEGAIVANGSACPVGMVVPANCIAEGVPARIVRRDITDDDRRQHLGLLPSDWVRRFAEWTADTVRSRLASR